MRALILFPHQLFDGNALLARGGDAYLVEDALFFRQYPFHKHKLILHRASMKAHAAHLAALGTRVHYVDAVDAPDMRAFVARLVRDRVRELHYIDPVDDWAERRLLREAAEAGLATRRHATPMFLSSASLLERQFAGRRRVRMSDFYAAQRRDLGILMNGASPAGGRWSFDAENRKRLPRGLVPPPPAPPPPNGWVREACRYVDANFAANPGTAEGFAYPVTRDEARAWLDDFVAHRLARFGDYEDAIAANEAVLFHSVLTPALNVGLLEPREVVDAALAAKGVPLNSLEGFVRQVIGWREYVRGCYVHFGRAQRTRNFWGHHRPLPAALWTGTSGLAPLDAVVKRVLGRAYAHHIERLMVLASFMQLAGIQPDEVYRWFMALFIDAYDWVMVPNVYGMALHADGGLMTTKPYISGANYLLRMSDFPRGPWCEDWDALYWTFVERNRDFFERNPRTSLAPKQLDRMDASRRASLRARAGVLLERLAA